MNPQLVLSAFGDTHIGRIRPLNEDMVLVCDEQQLYVVADGAGGHASGELASRLAIRSIDNYFGATVRATHERPEFDRFGIPSGARRLSRAILKANRDVIEVAQGAHRGMGTTVVAAAFSPRSALMHVASVGDSRCYRWRAGHLELMTQDHSLITDIIEQRPDLDDTMLDRLPKNVVTRALGMDESLRVSLRSHAVVAGDKYLLCSDGLSNQVLAEDIAETMSRDETPERTVQRLIAIANAAGGIDNIAALVVVCEGGFERARPADSVPPGRQAALEELEAGRESDPELLLLAIEDLDAAGAERAEDLARRLGELFGWKR